MSGSLWAMPIIVINMGGEMVYILQQRLQAQKVQEEKATKVMQDVIRAMYSPLFVTELFKPQEMYTASSTKQIFEKLAHSSIMRLNKQSMEKLYDLMIMGFKYQVVSCTAPQQVLQVTLHHLETLKSLVKSDTIIKSVQSAITSTLNLYTSLTNGQWLQLNQSLMRFLQGKKTKVSLFLQRNLQTMEGTIILNNDGALPYGTQTPGMISYYEGGNVVKRRGIEIEGYENCVESEEVFDMSSQLGFNMYINRELQEAMSGTPSFESIVEAGRDMGAQMAISGAASAKRNFDAPQAKSSAKAELNLLADLLGMGVSSKGEVAAKPFKINLFPDNSFEEKGSSAKASSNFIAIDIDGAAGAKTLDGYMRELKLKDEDDMKAACKGDDDDDLLALMDSATK